MKKKNKKAGPSAVGKSRIVDDDINFKNMKPIDDNELDIYDLAEEASQIAGIIDERPEEVRLMSEFRRKQQELFSKMSDDMSGRNAAAIVRDRKTGRKGDFKEETGKKREKQEKEAERLAQYAVWGKGVKQVEERQDKLKDDAYEASKQLARYAGDKDLDEMLKKQEWEGDPMLEYMRKKKKSKGEGAKSRVEYQGIYLPNRYGIKPGHRWDGVDRSGVLVTHM